MLAPAPDSGPTEGLRERSKRRRAERILLATRELLREDPERSPGVEQIAGRAEVAPATVFNLIGTRERIWAALAEQALAELEHGLADLSDTDPREHARRMVEATVEVIRGDAPVYRAVLAHWNESGRLLRRDPTGELAACLQVAARAGDLRTDLDLQQLAELISVGCTGAVHQWAARLIDDGTLLARCLGTVDLAFAAAAATDRYRLPPRV
jgi:AcrR family transcriptional regulator